MGIKKKEEEDICGGKPVGEDGKVDYRCAAFVYWKLQILACELAAAFISIFLLP